MRFSYIDVFLIAGLVLGGGLGYKGGLGKKLFNLLMLLIAAVAAARFMTPVAGFFSDAGVLTDTLAYAAAFAAVFIAVMVTALLLYHRFGKTSVGKTSASTVGILLGVIEGAMVISFVLMGLRVLDFPDEEEKAGSLLYRPMAAFVPKTFDLLQSYFPGASGFREEISDKFKSYGFFSTPSRPPKKP